MGINELVNVGARIKKLRKSKGYTQKEVADKLGIPYSTYSNYENGNREPNADQLYKIADVLEVAIGDLVDVWGKSSEVFMNSVYSLNAFEAIIKDIYGYVDSRCVESPDDDPLKDRFYYVIGKGEYQFILNESSYDSIYNLIKSNIEIMCNTLKEPLTEEQLIDKYNAEIRQELAEE